MIRSDDRERQVIGLMTNEYRQVPSGLERSAHRLAKAGLISRQKNSERVRGEPRISWWEFRAKP